MRNHLSPYLPFLATTRLEIQSGTLLPKATRVNPMTVSGTLNVKPTNVTIHTRIYEVTAIQMMQTMNERGYHLRHFGFLTSGIVK